MSLTLDAEGRYIQGPDTGKVAMILAAGAHRMVRPPRRFPPRRGRQLICVVINRGYDAAMWVQDEVDFQRCKRDDGRLVVWLEMKTQVLVNADRLPEIQKLSDFEGRVFPDMW